MIRIGSNPEVSEEALSAVVSGVSDPMLGLFVECVFADRVPDAQAGAALSGALLEAERPAEMSEGALARALDAIDSAPLVPGARGRPADLAAIRLPDALVAAIRDAEMKRAWKTMGPGIQVLDLGGDGEIRGELMRINAGVATPRHTHKGREATLCLHGGFTDGRGVSYGPGDVVFADGSVVHRPVADADGPCLVLAITDDGLRFTGVLGALQKLFGA